MADNSPPLLLTIAIEFRKAEDRKLFYSKLSEMLENTPEDIDFGFHHIEGTTDQFLLSGRDENHLDSVIEYLFRKNKIEINVGAPRVEYRETITRVETVDYTDKKKRLGGDVRVKLILEPAAPAIDGKMDIDFVDGNISKEFLRAIKQGVEWAFRKGPLGFPMIGIRVKLMTIDYRDNGPGFVQAVVYRAIKETLQHNKTCILEPYMKVEVVTSEDYMGDVIGDLNSRRGRIDAMDSNGRKRIIKATVPFANLFGYTNTLRSITGAEGKWTMSYSHYEPTPSPDDPSKQPAMIMRASSIGSE